MDNKTIYKKTLKFSLLRALWDLVAFAIVMALSVIGFAIAEHTADNGLIGLGIGLVVGGFCAGILLRFVSFRYKAGQIAMMTEGIVKGELPEDIVEAGKAIVKERFATVAAYYAVTSAIKGVFRQIGNKITAVSEVIGGEKGGAVGGTISTAINTIVEYLCDCCLGWVFYKKDEKATKSTLEGAVIFFRHGKTFLKNAGRIFGMGIASFVVIGGIAFGISYLFFQAFPDLANNLSTAFAAAIIRTGGVVPQYISDISYLTFGCAGVVAIIIWNMIHTAFVQPFILVGVLRNFIKSGQSEVINEEDFNELDKKSKKFAKLHSDAK